MFSLQKKFITASVLFVSSLLGPLQNDPLIYTNLCLRYSRFCWLFLLPTSYFTRLRRSSSRSFSRRQLSNSRLPLTTRSSSPSRFPGTLTNQIFSYIKRAYTYPYIYTIITSAITDLQSRIQGAKTSLLIALEKLVLCSSKLRRFHFFQYTIFPHLFKLSFQND